MGAIFALGCRAGSGTVFIGVATNSPRLYPPVKPLPVQEACSSLSPLPSQAPTRVRRPSPPLSPSTGGSQNRRQRPSPSTGVFQEQPITPKPSLSPPEPGHHVPTPCGITPLPDHPGGQRHLYSLSVSRSQVPPLRQGLLRQTLSRGVRQSSSVKPRRQTQV